MANRRAGPASALLAMAAILLASCSDGDGGSACSVAERNRFVHHDLLDRYLWYQRVPQSIDYDRFPSPAATLDYLRYAALDRFSYVTSQAAFDSLFNDGSYIGFGFSYGTDAEDRVRVRFVYRQSPAASAGFERGDEILAVNGENAAAISAAGRWSEVLGPPAIGVAVELEIRRRSGEVLALRLEKARVSINTVLHSEVFDIGANRVGYLVFASFIGPARAELQGVFADFREAGVNRLILDLRYNGGGALDVARDLASLIHGVDNAGEALFLELRYNDRLQHRNYRFYYAPQADTLDLDELVVITGAATCSASEQLVSALSPYLSSVVRVGATTCGKPVGMNPVDFCDQTLVAVNFGAYNAAGEGDYFSGLSADCPAGDDTGYGFGEAGEPMLAAARHYIEYATCPLAPRRAFDATPPLPGWYRVSGAV